MRMHDTPLPGLMLGFGRLPTCLPLLFNLPMLIRAQFITSHSRQTSCAWVLAWFFLLIGTAWVSAWQQVPSGGNICSTTAAYQAQAEDANVKSRSEQLLTVHGLSCPLCLTAWLVSPPSHANGSHAIPHTITAKPFATSHRSIERRPWAPRSTRGPPGEA